MQVSTFLILSFYPANLFLAGLPGLPGQPGPKGPPGNRGFKGFKGKALCCRAEMKNVMFHLDNYVEWHTLTFSFLLDSVPLQEKMVTATV